MNKFKKNLKKYYKTIRANLIYPFYTKLFVMKTIKTDINNYISENNINVMDDIIKKFGTEKQITRGFPVANTQKIILKNNIMLTLVLIFSLLLFFYQ